MQLVDDASSTFKGCMNIRFIQQSSGAGGDKVTTRLLWTTTPLISLFLSTIIYLEESTEIGKVWAVTSHTTSIADEAVEVWSITSSLLRLDFQPSSAYSSLTAASPSSSLTKFANVPLFSLSSLSPSQLNEFVTLYIDLRLSDVLGQFVFWWSPDSSDLLLRGLRSVLYVDCVNDFSLLSMVGCEDERVGSRGFRWSVISKSIAIMTVNELRILFFSSHGVCIFSIFRGTIE